MPHGAAGATGEDDGYVIVAVHDAESGRASVAVLDARRLSAGPVATIRLPHRLPAGLHGSFTPRVLRDDGGAEPKWAEPNTILQI